MAEISIVLPTYNGEKYLKDAIDCIICQTFLDWELIIVDDSSTDCTLIIAENYASEDSRIHVIHNEINQKLPKSLNIGFALSTGNYLTWTSDDNRHLPDALSAMHQYLEKNDSCYMVCSQTEPINEFGESIGELTVFDSDNIYAGNCVGASFLYRKEILDQIGGYNPDMIYVEDYDYWLRILQQFRRIDFLRKNLYQYRYHSNSLSDTKKIEIKKQLAYLRSNYIELIVSRLLYNQKALSQIYCDFLYAGFCKSRIPHTLMNVLPAIQGDTILNDSVPYIIFGAGTYGEKARDILFEQVSYYCDNDRSKIGSFKCGIRIISPEELEEIAGDYHVMIAVSDSNVYEIMEQLYELGIYIFYTYQMFISNHNDICAFGKDTII